MAQSPTCQIFVKVIATFDQLDVTVRSRIASWRALASALGISRSIMQTTALANLILSLTPSRQLGEGKTIHREGPGWLALVTRASAWALVVLVAAAEPAAWGDLPLAIQADRLLVQADREEREGRVVKALATLDAVRSLREEYGLETPEEFWYRYAVVADAAGEHERAVEHATRYLGVAGQEGEHYEAALRLLDAAEQAVEEDERKLEAERLAREAETRRREYGETRRRQVEQREGHAYTALRARLREERNRLNGAFADQLKSGGEGPEMVAIPGGRFQMGCKNRRDKRRCTDLFDSVSLPLHRVTVPGFALARREATVAEWNACVDGGGCGDRRWYKVGGVRTKDAIARHYVPARAAEYYGYQALEAVYVTWDEAQQYVRWLSTETGKNYRLPSEAEWEYAARAGTRTPFSYGAEREERFDEAVATYPPNPFGLYGMHSNQEEWTQDCWNKNYEGAPRDGSAWLRGDCTRRVYRNFIAWAMNRRWSSVNDESDRVGIRVALSAGE